MMTKRASLVEMIMLACLTVVFSGVAAAPAQEAEAPVEAAATGGTDEAAEAPKLQRIKLKDGREIEGQVTRTESGDIRIQAKYGVLTFKADDVVSVEDVVPPQDAYLERKSEIDANDADALYGLARWVMAEHGNNRDLLENAQADLQNAMKLKKDFKRAELLLRMVDERLKGFTDGGDDPTEPIDGPTKFAEGDLVTERDIYSIRLQELHASERIGIKFQNDVIDRFIELMRQAERTGWDDRGTEKKFRGLSPQRKLAYMMEQEPLNWNLLKDVLVTTDPEFMRDFRNKIWPIIRRTAASAKNNYGANLMDGFQFKISAASGGEAVDYTNFVILVGYKKGKARLVDRQKPEDSLILKAGLQETIDPEKDPRSIVPSYTMVNSNEYKMVLDWIKSLKGPLEPDYHLEWKPPQGVTIDCDGKPDLPGLGE